MIKVAVIGYGYSAQTFHLPYIKERNGFELVAIGTSRPEKIERKFQGITIYTDPTELLNHSDAELIVVSTPNDSHYHLTKSALLMNKHVLVEKPFVVDPGEGEELIELSQKRNLILSVFHNRRWDGDFLTIKKMIDRDKFGQIKVFESHFDRFRPVVRNRWREKSGDGTGIWYDLGSHLVDQVLTLFSEPDAVTGRCLNTRNNSVCTDYFHVQLHYPGFEVILHGSSFCAGPQLRFQVHGSEGSYVKYGMDPQESLLTRNIYPDSEEWELEHKDHFGTFYSPEDKESVPTEPGDYSSFYKLLAGAISTFNPNPVCPIQALKVIEIIRLAERSSDERKTLYLR